MGDREPTMIIDGKTSKRGSTCTARQAALKTIACTAAVLLGSLPEFATAQAPDPGSYSTAKDYELQERRGVMVPMRDGVRLSIDLYVPKTSEKLPVVLA